MHVCVATDNVAEVCRLNVNAALLYLKTAIGMHTSLWWRSRDGSGPPEKQRAWPSILSAVVAAVGSLTVGYAMGYSSSALLDLAELGGGFAIQTGSVESKVFVVSSD